MRLVIDALFRVALAIMLASIAVAIGWTLWSRRPSALGCSARILGVGAALATVLTVASLVGTSTSLAGLEVDAMSGIMLVLVLGMGATVLGFAARNLRDEAYQQQFGAVGAGLVGVGALLALTTDLVVLTLAWLATSALTVALIRTGPQAGTEARSARARRSFVVGDAALVAAVAVLIIATGATSIRGIAAADDTARAVAGVLLVAAALARSASGPWVRWLPDSLGAPTPSSALLHAGVVSGGAIVLIKLAPAVAGSRPAALTALVFGGATCVFAEAVMLTRPDVKGRLAWSTIAQMSFTIVLCGLGLVVAAAVHLVAHGFYKAALFLGSGSAVRGLVRQRGAPPVSAGIVAIRRRQWSVASMASVAAIGSTAALLGGAPQAELAVPLGLACVAGTCAIAAALARSVTIPQGALAVASGALALVVFAGFTVTLDHAIASSLVRTTPDLGAAWVLPVLAGLVAVALTRGSDSARRMVLGWMWRQVRDAGRPTAAHGLVLARPVPARVALAGPVPEPALAPSLTGV